MTDPQFDGSLTDDELTRVIHTVRSDAFGDFIGSQLAKKRELVERLFGTTDPDDDAAA